MEAISKSRKKAGEALGKMKARGKTFAARKTHRSTADTVGPSGRVNNALRNAVAAVQAENALKKGGRRDKPKMRLLVERLLGMRRWVLGGVIRSPGLAVNPRIAVGTKVLEYWYVGIFLRGFGRVCQVRAWRCVSKNRHLCGPPE